MIRSRAMILLLTFFGVFSNKAFSQWEFREIIKHDNITYPKTSKWASVSQEIGITTIKVDYHSPAAKNRNIWGELIPFGRVWRAGAEESTVITVMDSVMVEGKGLPSGKYGLHIVPSSDSATVIFSKNHMQWGSFFYKQEEDQLRVTVPIRLIDHVEYLKYEFNQTSENGVILTLKWADVAIDLSIEVDEISTALSVIRDELRTLPRFTWRGSREAALFCWLHNSNLEQALDWINLSIEYEEKFENIFVKFLILKSLNQDGLADQTWARAIELGDVNDVIFVARESIGHHNSLNKAIEILDIAIAIDSTNYSAHMQKGVAFGWRGDKDKSKDAFENAIRMAKTQQEKARVRSRMAEHKFD